MEQNEWINIEVAYGTRAKQYLLKVKMPTGATVREAILVSGILEQIPEINLSQQKIGIFSKPCDMETSLKEGDRIELYRPLLIDPKEARRAKAKAKKVK